MLPTVSVILPVRNEAAFIERSLGAVLAQDYPAELTEVIVADGMSDDGTLEAAGRLLARRANARVIANPERIVATGLNRATREARGEIIIRVDGHAEVAPDYVRRCVEHLRQGADGVGGAVETIGEGPMAQAIAAAMSSKFGVGDSAFRTERGQTKLVDTVPFPAYTRALVDRAGPYDPELVRNQDDEYNYRLRKMGARLLLAADVRSRYYSRSSLRSLWRQYRQYGYWKVRVLQKHPLQMRARQFVPPAFVAALIATAVAAAFSPMGRVALGALAAVYAVANMSATLVVLRRERLIQPSVLPVVFATLHVAYGVGFLHGLIQFWNRWTLPGSRRRIAAPDGVDAARSSMTRQGG
jgi:glycosyltransferase involved in cell wall biosynthesis